MRDSQPSTKDRRWFLAVARTAATAAVAVCLGGGIGSTDDGGDEGRVVETTDVSMVGASSTRATSTSTPAPP